jgi:hypothetical protein
VCAPQAAACASLVCAHTGCSSRPESVCRAYTSIHTTCLSLSAFSSFQARNTRVHRGLSPHAPPKLFNERCCRTDRAQRRRCSRNAICGLVGAASVDERHCTQRGWCVIRSFPFSPAVSSLHTPNSTPSDALSHSAQGHFLGMSVSEGNEMKLRCAMHHRPRTASHASPQCKQVLRACAATRRVLPGLLQEQRHVASCVIFSTLHFGRVLAHIAHCELPHLPFISDEASGVARGVIALDKAATVRRTKNVRDGFEYCIRIDAPNAANGSGANAVGAKRWTKLVMVLRNEPEMAAWIEAIQSGVAGGPVVAASRVLFEPPRQRTDSTVVFQGTALKEVHEGCVCILFIEVNLLAPDSLALLRRIPWAFLWSTAVQ